LLALGFGLFYPYSEGRATLFGITEDPSFGKFSPNVPVLVPLAFTGELVYRLDYFLANAGDLIPTFGRQFESTLKGIRFCPSTCHLLDCFCLLSMGTASSAYVLHIFNTRISRE